MDFTRISETGQLYKKIRVTMPCPSIAPPKPASLRVAMSGLSLPLHSAARGCPKKLVSPLPPNASGGPPSAHGKNSPRKNTQTFPVFQMYRKKSKLLEIFLSIFKNQAQINKCRQGQNFHSTPCKIPLHLKKGKARFFKVPWRYR